MDRKEQLLVDQYIVLLKEYYRNCYCWAGGWGPCRTCQKLLNLEIPEIGLDGQIEKEQPKPKETEK